MSKFIRIGNNIFNTNYISVVSLEKNTIHIKTINKQSNHPTVLTNSLFKFKSKSSDNIDHTDNHYIYEYESSNHANQFFNNLITHLYHSE